MGTILYPYISSVGIAKIFPYASERSPLVTFQPFAEVEASAIIIIILVVVGVHRSKKENLEDECKVNALPLTRATILPLQDDDQVY